MKRILHFLIAGALLFSINVRADIAVIVAPSVKLDSITTEQLGRLYLRRANRYPDGVKLTPVDQESGSEIRKQFIQKVLWKTEIEVAEYWSRRMYSGKGRPPQRYRDDAAVIEAVTADPGVIGYINSDDVTDQVKVLLTLP